MMFYETLHSLLALRVEEGPQVKNVGSLWGLEKV